MHPANLWDQQRSIGSREAAPPKREKESQRKKDGSAPIVTVSLRSREINSLA
jgi:hypothetical protein